MQGVTEYPSGSAAEVMMAESPAKSGPFRHVGFFYRTAQEYATTVAAFLADGVAAGEPAFAAVPAGQLSLVADALGADARRVEFADMAELGRNPGRIIPRVQAFVDLHGGQHVRYVGEPIWASRSSAELREATRHEALINLAFAGADAEILCPYDTTRLGRAVIAEARQTHPLLLSGGKEGTSPEYCGPFGLPSSCGAPLPAWPDTAVIHPYRSDLSQVRALVLKSAREAGLPDERADDLVLAVSEVAANTLRHTPSSGTLAIWHDSHEIVCEVHDKGVITDPLAGRRRPAPAALGGHGLWLVHQVCDLVELRSDTTGTTVRMHMAIRSPRPLG
jgi:anti-sigma regulatory factor (Ser/Thr protein kinase)